MKRSSIGLPVTAMIVLAFLTSTSPAAAQTPSAQPQASAGKDEAAALAKQLANPVSSLISMPFQSNWDFGVGPDDAMRSLINFQPVMPFSMGKNWNWIARVIVPLLSQPALTPGGESKFGVSDILFSSFISPALPSRRGGIIWGVGPAISIPMTTDPVLGSGKWSAGPTFVVVKQSGPWTYGMLANHIWSYAKTSDTPRPDVSQTFVQPFVAYGVKGWTFTLNTETTASWEAPAGDKWTVPINLTFSKVMRLGRRPLSLGAGGGYYAEGPDDGPTWKLRTTLTVLLPK